MLGSGAYMTSFLQKSHWDIRLGYLQLISQGTAQPSEEQRLPAGAPQRWMPKGGREEGGGKEGLSGEVTCCPSLEKDRMMDEAWQQRSKDRGRLRLQRSEVAVTGAGT